MTILWDPEWPPDATVTEFTVEHVEAALLRCREQGTDKNPPGVIAVVPVLAWVAEQWLAERRRDDS